MSFALCDFVNVLLGSQVKTLSQLFDLLEFQFLKGKQFPKVTWVFHLFTNFMHSSGTPTAAESMSIFSGVVKRTFHKQIWLDHELYLNKNWTLLLNK